MKPASPPAALSTPERRLLLLLAAGLTVAEAGSALCLPPPDTEAMLADLLRRCEASSPRRLFVRALVHRWI